MNKEDYTDLCAFLINKAAAISFLSCSVDFRKINITENLDKIRSVQIRGDSELQKVSNFLDKIWGLKRLEYIGINSFDQLHKYAYRSKLPQLARVCISTYFDSTAMLEHYLGEQLPQLEYLELSSVILTDDLLRKCTEKFKQTVVFGSPDLTIQRRQQLTAHFTIQIQLIFARDFPVNLAKPQHLQPPQEKKFGGYAGGEDGYVPDEQLQSISSIDPTVTSNHKRNESDGLRQPHARNMQVMATTSPTPVDERIPREARAGEIKFK